MNIVPRSTDSAHWYYPDSRRCYEVQSKGSQWMRKPTLRDAKELGLLPGASAICKLWPNSALDDWKKSQIILAAVTTPRFTHESDDLFVSRVLASADEEASNAADVGTRRHKIIEEFHKTGNTSCAKEDVPFIEPYVQWFANNVRDVIAPEKIVVNLVDGYAGCTDLHCILRDGRTAVCDLKNRRKARAYPGDGMQLAGYAKPLLADAIISLVLGTTEPELLVKEWEQFDCWGDFELCLKLWKRARDYDPAQHPAVVAERTKPEPAAA